MHKCHFIGILCKALAGAPYGALVAVNSDKSAGVEALQYLLGVPTESKSTINVYAVRLYVQIFNTFV